MARKNLAAAFLIILSGTITGCKATVEHVVVDPAASTVSVDTNPLEGKWLSDCMDMVGDGTGYAKIYVVLAGVNEAFAILWFGSDATCTAAYSMTNMSMATVTDAEPTFTIALPFTAYIDHPGYSRISITTLDNSLHIYQLFYIASTTEFYSAAQPPTTDPGSSWAQMSGDAGLSAFASDFHNGVHFTKTSGLP